MTAMLPGGVIQGVYGLEILIGLSITLKLDKWLEVKWIDRHDLAEWLVQDMA